MHRNGSVCLRCVPQFQCYKTIACCSWQCAVRGHASPHFYPQRDDVDMLRISAPTSVVTHEVVDCWMPYYECRRLCRVAHSNLPVLNTEHFNGGAACCVTASGLCCLYEAVVRHAVVVAYLTSLRLLFRVHCGAPLLMGGSRHMRPCIVRSAAVVARTIRGW